ncbi:MAG: transporter permease [Patescibacteria group bacterium]|nr:transporter permease [Patescibacteria group bacterium]
MKELSAIATIAYRDVLGLFRDRTRLLFSLFFSVIFISVVGGMLGQNIGHALPFDYTQFVFFGFITQMLFQGALVGLVTLIRDRESNFSQEIFIAPISRYSIILGKVLGSSITSIITVLGMVVYGLVTGIKLSWLDLAAFVPVTLAAAVMGAALGLLLIGNLKNQQTANMIFPLIIFPQTFVAGVLTPINSSSWWLSLISHIAPLTYVVDFMRNMLAFHHPAYQKLILYPMWVDMAVIAAMSVVFIVVGTWAFVRGERNR